jgi:hypothetical protein
LQAFALPLLQLVFEAKVEVVTKSLALSGSGYLYFYF